MRLSLPSPVNDYLSTASLGTPIICALIFFFKLRENILSVDLFSSPLSSVSSFRFLDSQNTGTGSLGRIRLLSTTVSAEIGSLSAHHLFST